MKTVVIPLYHWVFGSEMTPFLWEYGSTEYVAFEKQERSKCGIGYIMENMGHNVLGFWLIRYYPLKVSVTVQILTFYGKKKCFF